MQSRTCRFPGGTRRLCWRRRWPASARSRCSWPAGRPAKEPPTCSTALTVVSVALAWATVHTIFTTRYARLYYTDTDGAGVDFNEQTAPQYSDFAYLAFTIGMTFQVSDTDLKTKPIRSVALRHALLSYMFGAIIIAVTINLVAGLAK